MFIIGLAEEPICIFCQEVEETVEQILCHWVGLNKVWFLQMGTENLTENSCIKEPLSKLWSLIMGIKLDKAF